MAAARGMGTLECVRETLRLALEDLGETVSQEQRPGFWEPLWERYVESQLDYQASAETLKQKMIQAGQDGLEQHGGGWPARPRHCGRASRCNCWSGSGASSSRRLKGAR